MPAVVVETVDQGLSSAATPVNGENLLSEDEKETRGEQVAHEEARDLYRARDFAL